jgi:hypothetical protein
MAEPGSNGKQGLTRRLAHKALKPIVASAASAAAGYVATKGPELFERTVAPKLKSSGGGGGAQRAQNGRTQRSTSRAEVQRHIEERKQARAARRRAAGKG